MIRIGKILAFLLFIFTAQGIYFFFRVLGADFTDWLAFNACAPSNITYIIGFILFLIFKNRTILCAAVLPMFFFGTLGMFVFPWDGMNIIVQLSHIVMTLNIIWAVIEIYKSKKFKEGFYGFLVGVILFAPFIGWQQNYAANNRDFFEKMTNYEK